MDQYGAIAAYVYAGRYGDTPDNLVSRSTHPDWILCAFVDGNMVATFATIPFTMRLNGRGVRVGGVSSVGTLPEFRRRGIMRDLLNRAIGDMKERGQTIAVLWASQAAIYQRYHFSQATQGLRYTLDPRDIRFAVGNRPRGHCQRHSPEEGFPIVRQLYIDFVAPRTGYLHRSRELWHNNTLAENPGDGPVHVAVYYDTQGQPRAYMVYTVRHERVADAARPQEMTIRDMAWLDQEAYLGLWEFVARHDLVGRVRVLHAPSDDPAQELFEEPRLLYPQPVEGIWMRMVDVAGALEARGYTTSGHLTLEVAGDERAPWNNGVFLLEASPEGARATRTQGEAQVRLHVKAMASLYSGFRSARELAGWGLLEGDHQGIESADRLFHTLYAPHCPDHF